MSLTNKLTVLVLIQYYLPGERAGGPIRTTANMVKWLGDDITFKILTGDRDIGGKAPYVDIQHQKWQAVGKAQVRYLSPEEMRLSSLHRIIKATDFDLYYIDSVFETLTLKFLLLYRLGLLPHRPRILVTRGHLNSGALALKSTKKQFFLRVARLVGLYGDLIWHASNQTEKHDIQRTINNVPDTHIHIISNLPDPDLLYAVEPSQKKIPQSLRLVFLSRISPKKNLHYALQRLHILRDNVVFDIYGPLEDQQYWEKCQAVIATLPDNVRVTYCGTLGNNQVTQTLQQYHLLFLPTLGENFGHVILESLCAGCPVLISDQTPWGKVVEAKAGWVYPLDTPQQFEKTLHAIQEMNHATWINHAQQAQQFGRAYVEDSAHSDQMKDFFYSVISDYNDSECNKSRE